MNWLLILAIVLFALWIAAEALGWLLGAALNLFWIAAVILLVIWAFQKLRANV